MVHGAECWPRKLIGLYQNWSLVLKREKLIWRPLSTLTSMEWLSNELKACELTFDSHWDHAGGNSKIVCWIMQSTHIWHTDFYLSWSNSRALRSLGVRTVRPSPKLLRMVKHSKSERKLPWRLCIPHVIRKIASASICKMETSASYSRVTLFSLEVCISCSHCIMHMGASWTWADYWGRMWSILWRECEGDA